MKVLQNRLLFHLMAFSITAVWGTTFISTKVLLSNGMTPAWIFLIRFTIAYMGLWALCLQFRTKDMDGGSVNRLAVLSRSKKDELLFLLLGITGGSLYFLTENNALANTQACNVSFIVCSAPLFVTILTILARKAFKGSMMDELEDVRVGLPLICGTIMALVGMAMVIFDGNNLSLSVKGDLLSLAAALCWAVYSLFMSQMTNRYGTLFSTRKVFFYGLITIIPVILVSGQPFPADTIFNNRAVWLNLLFLGFVASLVCFVGWNRSMAGLGNVTSTNYVYLNPVFTLVGAVLILDESMTWTSAIGSALIMGGVILAGIRKSIIVKRK